MRDGTAYYTGNKIHFSGVMKGEHIPLVMNLIRHISSVARYPDIIFDMSRVEGAYGSFLTALLARIKYLQANRIDVGVIPPIAQPALAYMARLNWLALVSTDKKGMRSFRPDKPLPIFHYTDADAQGHAVACITKSLLFQIPDLDRRQLRAAQWALYEVTDNVLNHASSLVGGFVHCQVHHNMKLIEVVVADAGIGVPRSLGEVDQGYALQRAIAEGVTRNKLTNQGNGLYGTWRLATLSNGIFVIHSQRGRLFVRPGGTVKVEGKADTFPGTYIIFQIDYSDVNLIANALSFDGRIHDHPFDFIEEHFEGDSNSHTTVRLADHVASTGSRESGRKVSNLINNVIRMSEDNRVDIDFDGILIVSSSFADECFGRLIARMGPAEFFSKITFVNADTAIRAIIDRSVLQRLRVQAEN